LDVLGIVIFLDFLCVFYYGILGEMVIFENFMEFYRNLWVFIWSFGNGYWGMDLINMEKI